MRARAQLAGDPVATTAEDSGRPALWGRWAAVAASLVVLGLLLWPRLVPAPHASVQATSRLSNVDSVDVFVDHGSLMIIQDQKNGGTLVWLAATQTTPNGGG